MAQIAYTVMFVGPAALVIELKLPSQPVLPFGALCHTTTWLLFVCAPPPITDLPEEHDAEMLEELLPGPPLKSLLNVAVLTS